MTAIKVFAPAKINLTLHVTGQRRDGYHLLDSLVAFASIGDWLTIEDAPTLTLVVRGANAADVPNGAENLVIRAAQALGPGRCAIITLDKVLPVASGIGGGSADAAAALRGLTKFWGLDELGPTQQAAIVALGADVPMCLLSAPLRAEGIGERLTILPPLPEVHVVLVNPGAPVSTPAIFGALERRDNPPMPSSLPRFDSAKDLAEFVATQRNDMEPAAQAQLPVIALVRSALSETQGCLFARMSGSGATCFGLYPSAAAARNAAQQIKKAHGDWWVAGGELLRDATAAGPQLTRATT